MSPSQLLMTCKNVGKYHNTQTVVSYFTSITERKTVQIAASVHPILESLRHQQTVAIILVQNRSILVQSPFIPLPASSGISTCFHSGTRLTN
jgi:hypothetical protein